MAFAVLNYFSQTLLSVIEAVVGQILNVFTVSSLIGSYVVIYAAALAEVLYYALDSLFTVVRIICEDFLIFLYDVFGILTTISGIFIDLLVLVIEICKAILTDFKDVIVYILMLPVIIYFEFLSVIENIVLFVANAADLLKRALTLLGTCIWVAFMFVPCSFVSVFHLVTQGFVKLACASQNCILDLIRDAFGRLGCIAWKLFKFFIDVPHEACAGLAVGILLLWIAYKEQHVIKWLCGNVYQLHLEVAKMFIHLIKQPFQCLIHQAGVYRRHYMFRRRGHVTQSVAADIFSECGSGPDSTSQQSDSSNYMLKLKKKLEKELEEKMCSVCQERRKTVIVLPCRHLCMCEECVSIVNRISRKCPLCRRNIAKTMGVYL